MKFGFRFKLIKWIVRKLEWGKGLIFLNGALKENKIFDDAQ